MNTLKEHEYIPLKLRFRLMTAETAIAALAQGYCEKMYTTRLHPLHGEYRVVKGSRYGRTPVLPEIKFRVEHFCYLDLRNGLVSKDLKTWAFSTILDRGDLSFAELDLGHRGVTFEDLRRTLLDLNKKASIDTIFYVNLLEPIL